LAKEMEREELATPVPSAGATGRAG